MIEKDVCPKCQGFTYWDDDLEKFRCIDCESEDAMKRIGQGMSYEDFQKRILRNISRHRNILNRQISTLKKANLKN